ncbi:Disease resistance protein [Quillaja saponaria]|uniref:Disease resistance protein n=1 Tax=Quillaja saponaria TaxID=32244 RepID=A0AAD7M1B7_QUISA|nr:Disease resistance protein [Quillaja saponaria]
MINSGLRVLPEKPTCNNIFTLLLQQNSDLTIIPQAFFENMSSLLVLDLHGTKIRKLPSSLSVMINLKALYLHECESLTELPPEIKSLQHLEVLDIRDSKVKFIPVHIQHLVNLKCLRISCMESSYETESRALVMYSNVIASLQKLEELIIEMGPDLSMAVAMSNMGRREFYNLWSSGKVFFIQEVASLENLTTLRICFADSYSLAHFITNNTSWKNHKFTSFRFFVGCQYLKHPQILECLKCKITRYMKYNNGTLKDDSPITKVLAETDAFELIYHHDISKLSDFVEAASLKCLRSWLILGCNKMSTIVDCNLTQQRDKSNVIGECILPNLEQLYLVSLVNLKSIFEGSMHPGSLSKLQILEVINCPILKSIFTNGVIQQFSRLQKLTVQDCNEIEDLFTESDGSETELLELPELKTLVLINLPKLRTLCLVNYFVWPSFEVLKIYGCPQLKALPFTKENAINLRSIEGQLEWWIEVQWDNLWRQEVASIQICSISYRAAS